MDYYGSQHRNDDYRTACRPGYRNHRPTVRVRRDCAWYVFQEAQCSEYRKHHCGTWGTLYRTWYDERRHGADEGFGSLCQCTDKFFQSDYRNRSRSDFYSSDSVIVRFGWYFAGAGFKWSDRYSQCGFRTVRTEYRDMYYFSDCIRGNEPECEKDDGDPFYVQYDRNRLIRYPLSCDSTDRCGGRSDTGSSGVTNCQYAYLVQCSDNNYSDTIWNRAGVSG